MTYKNFKVRRNGTLKSNNKKIERVYIIGGNELNGSVFYTAAIKEKTGETTYYSFAPYDRLDEHFFISLDEKCTLNHTYAVQKDS